MIKLHGFSQSGNTYKVALMLRLLDEPFETVHVDFFKGVTRDAAWREGVNPMGEAPVLEDGPLVLTQSGVILHHLAAKHGRYGGRDAAEQREVLRWILFDNHKFTSYFASYRFARAFGPSAPDPAVMAWLRGRIDAAYSIVDRRLGLTPWIAGDAPTIADFSLAGYVFYPVEESGYDLRALHPNIAAWTDRIAALPGWAGPYDLLPGERVSPRWV